MGCFEEEQPEPADSLTSFFGDCPVSGNCASSPSNLSSRCSLVSPAGWVTYTQEEGEYNFLYVAGEVYDGTIGRWGVELLVGGVINWVPHGNISSGWEVCWTESRPVPSSLTVFSGGCRVSGGCVVSNSSDDIFTTCALVSPPGWISYAHFQDGAPQDDLFVDGVLYDGAAGPWGIEIPDGGASLWTLSPGADGREVCWTETRPDVPEVLTVFSGTCNVSGDCITSPNYPSTYDSPSLCVMWSPVGALFVQDFVIEKAFDVLYVDGVSYTGFYGPWDVDLPDGSPLFWVADSSAAERGWRICLASDSSSSTSSSSSSTSTSGYHNSTSDESPESVSSSSTTSSSSSTSTSGYNNSTSDESPESVSSSGGAFCGGVIVVFVLTSARCAMLP